MLRFRPNVVFSGLPAFAEHQYQSLRSENGDTVLGLKDHCQRCAVITVDQKTGIASPTQHPFAALAQLNSMPGKPKAPVFGVNTVLVAGNGSEIRCGDQWQAE
ncbi:MAG: MOSC domain-containing protein [Cellvibrionaceae bacterium]|nr:MOSC domain-containing protein [Cellvibrionaceae bacterium]